MINVLDLIDQYRIGGPGKTIINTAKFIDKNQFTLHVGSFVPDGCETELTTEAMKNGIHLLLLKDIRGISAENFKTILTYIDKNNISVFHSHGYKADIYGMLLRSFRKKLVILTTHHGWIRNTWTQVILGGFVAKASFQLDHTIIVSHEMKRHLPKITLKKNQYSVIHNAIRVDDYKETGVRDKQRSVLGVQENDIVLLSVGRLSKEKGCKNLLDAFEIVHQQYNNVKLVYIGDGPLMTDLKDKIEHNNLSENVLLCGHHQHVQSFYEAADIFICPSDTEGLSNAILEAMAFSIPVIATDVGGNPEIIVHQVNGLLVPPKNIPALKDAICSLVSNRSVRQKLGHSGYDTVLSAFSFNRRTLKIEDLYTRLVKEKNAAQA